MGQGRRWYRNKQAWLACLVACLFFFPVQAAPQLQGVTLEADGAVTRCILTFSSPASARHFLLGNPPRLVVDVPQASWAAGIASKTPGKGAVQRVRIARHDATTTRIVFDLAGPVSVAAADSDPKRLEFILTLAGTQPGETTSEPITGIDTPGASDIPVPLPKPAALQQESQKPMIVIDAGHGGVDPGAVAADGLPEKEITLEYALALYRALEATGRYRVALTRGDDRFILLRGRTELARRAVADVFVSLHADSAPEGQASGLSLYTLSENASDKEAAALAAAENKVDILSGLDLSSENKEVASILIDLAQRETNNKSYQLAETLVKQLKGEVRLLPSAHREAGFAVLKAPDIPSVLIELGFLSSPRDRKLLATQNYQDKVVQGIVKGMDDYFRRFKKH